MEHEAHLCCPVTSQGEERRPSFDYLLWGSLILVAAGYLGHLLMPSAMEGYAAAYAHAAYSLMNKMWWGLAIGLVFVALLGRIPREMVLAVIGRPGTVSGVLRATLAGVMLDLCSHGILLVGTKLYERGAGLGQMAAFLIASPWNSLSLTLILASLIGWTWTLLFVVFSAVIAIISGILFDALVRRGVLPPNPHHLAQEEEMAFWKEARRRLAAVEWNLALLRAMLREGIVGSQMILRWIFFGVVLASLIRTFVPPEMFGTLFGPTLAGLGLTLLVATLLEVCSEGSTPIAADLLTRAAAPGNAFAFLMAGVATDYTEVMVVREATRSWKIALFLPLVTLPQVVVLAWIMNM